METEQRLYEAANSGDRQAMRRLYDRYVGWAMATGLRYIPERADAEDVVQDAFVKVLTHLNQFHYRGEGSLKAWVGRIVVNCALDFLKERRLWQGTLVEVAMAEENDLVAEEEPEVEGVPPDVLLELIGQLPAGYRTVLNLFVFEGMSHKEIASRLGIKPDTSASQFFRAKSMLGRLIREKKAMKEGLNKQERR